MKNTILNSVQLARASTLAANIEAINVDLTAAQARVNDLTGQLAPIQTEYNSIMGNEAKACSTIGTRKFTPEQCAKISAGQKARWAKQKAAQAAVVSAPEAVTETVAVPANA